MKMRRFAPGIIAVLALLLTPVGQTSASVQDFYFSDFTADYYLSKDAEGISHLKVLEKVTAEFPDYNQNKGICRQIPFSNQNGANITLPSLARSDIVVMRNGASEPIYSIEKGSGYYDVCTGTNDYVLGTQVYTFEYEFEKVVTEFSENGREWQELYWDTNGNGATQRFDKVTARVHLDDVDWWTGESWCYVGRYGESGKDRCEMQKLDDGMMFMATGLKGGENLTFDMELELHSFVVPEPEKNYAYVWTLIGLMAICMVAIAIAVRKFLKSREKARFYKDLFVKPEYQPNKDYSLPEMAELYIGKKKDAKVAMLLELVVNRKIEFKKKDKRKWSIIVKNVDGISDEYMDLLEILNGGTKPVVGGEIELKSRSATSRLIALKNSMESKILSDLKRDKLVGDKYKIGGSGSHGAGSIIVTTMFMVPIVIMIGIGIMKMLEGVLDYDGAFGGEMVFAGYFFPTALVIIIVTVTVCVTLSDAAQKCEKHTELGLTMSRYMDGLRLYIEMAEEERMKMLQSVKGADTSPEGIVHLYEKLLPYAAVFGLEESWINEMKEYCKVEEVEEPDYLMTGIATAELSRTMRMASDMARTATVMSSSGGGSSSGFSGGGGGGFSGGGGGGGGFGGR